MGDVVAVEFDARRVRPAGERPGEAVDLRPAGPRPYGPRRRQTARRASQARVVNVAAIQALVEAAAAYLAWSTALSHAEATGEPVMVQSPRCKGTELMDEACLDAWVLDAAGRLNLAVKVISERDRRLVLRTVPRALRGFFSV